MTNNLSFWSIDTALRFRDFDYLGHMTATAYLALIEEARVAWLAAASQDGQPSYVLARQNLEFHREILAEDSPIKITIRPMSIGERHVEVEELLVGSRGTIHATSRATLVAWDRALRVSRPFSAVERGLLESRSSALKDSLHSEEVFSLRKP